MELQTEHTMKLRRKIRKTRQSLGCAATDCVAASCPVPRSLPSEPKTILPTPDSPLFPCDVALSLPPFCVLPYLGAAGEDHIRMCSSQLMIDSQVSGWRSLF